MKRIVLCADDFGQAPHISNGILDLVAKKRLTAVGCMVNTASWQEDAIKLQQYKDNIDIGLHFNLTHGAPLSEAFRKKYGATFPSLPMLIRKSYLFKLDKHRIADELNAQIDTFEAAMGFLPRFLDGHQHIHHLPVIRKVVVDIYNQRLKGGKSYLRKVDMNLSPADLFNKKIVIYMTGMRRFKQLLEVHLIPHNRTFSGIYDFRESERYPQLFLGFLQEIEDGGLIMCHPGLAADDASDPIRAARVCEYNYLVSGKFEQDLIGQKVVLSTFA